jgi:hypothetical protein
VQDLFSFLQHFLKFLCVYKRIASAIPRALDEEVINHFSELLGGRFNVV